MTVTHLERLVTLCAFAALLGAAPACSFDGSSPGAPGGGGDDNEEDAGDDGDGGIGPRADAAPPDAMPDPCLTWDPSTPFMPCDIDLADRGGELVLDDAGEYLYNTDTGALMSPIFDPLEHSFFSIGGDTIHVLTVQRLEIADGSVLRVEGADPLLIVSWSDIEVAGVIDVSSSVDPLSVDGAAANSTECSGSEGEAGDDNVTGGGGGGGGGFSGPGGLGGFGGGEDENGGAGGVAETGGINLRGGCAGGDGGPGAQSGVSAEGGASGGAVALSALIQISVGGAIHAGGAGGQGANDDEGGGAGGGSGGMLWLDAPAISLGAGAVLASNGGGGGEGATGPNDGLPGQDGQSDGQPATGGAGGGVGANGGDGSGQGAGKAVLAGTEGFTREINGGGGGGGGAGIIRIIGELSANPSSLITPPATN